ncbi:MFS transporter, partial [candidate division KSB1 bacterium]|nr:MFS transporter [candidate division KSB1 bacterium]
TIIGVVLTKWFSKILDKKNTYAGFLIAAALVNALFYVARPQDVMLIYVLNLLFSFFVGPVSVLQWAMYTDTADFSEWKNHRRATALLMAASLFALKLGLALGGTFVGWILGFYGFVANQSQTPEAMKGIVLLLSIFPAIFGIAGGLLMIRYPLTNKMMVKIEEDLTARRQQA